jgi:hypothetical protein
MDYDEFRTRRQLDERCCRYRKERRRRRWPRPRHHVVRPESRLQPHRARPRTLFVATSKGTRLRARWQRHGRRGNPLLKESGLKGDATIPNIAAADPNAVAQDAWTKRAAAAARRRSTPRRQARSRWHDPHRQLRLQDLEDEKALKKDAKEAYKRLRGPQSQAPALGLPLAGVWPITSAEQERHHSEP